MMATPPHEGNATYLITYCCGCCLPPGGLTRGCNDRVPADVTWTLPVAEPLTAWTARPGLGPAMKIWLRAGTSLESLRNT